MTSWIVLSRLFLSVCILCLPAVISAPGWAGGFDRILILSTGPIVGVWNRHLEKMNLFVCFVLFICFTQLLWNIWAPIFVSHNYYETFPELNQHVWLMHFYMVLYSLGLECIHFDMVIYSLGPVSPPPAAGPNKKQQFLQKPQFLQLIMDTKTKKNVNVRIKALFLHSPFCAFRPRWVLKISKWSP